MPIQVPVVSEPPPEGDYPWLPIADCLRECGNIDPESENAADVERKRLAAGSYVEDVRPDLFLGDPPTFTPKSRVVAGAVLLTSRLYARKGSPLGVASFAEFGPADVIRYDPDIERMLGLGRHAGPVVG